MENKRIFFVISMALIGSFLYAIPRRVARLELKDGHEKGKFTLRSAAFVNRGFIPPLYTCDGKDISPELNWSNPPYGTKSYAIIFHDTNILEDPWNHWVVINIHAAYDHLDQHANVNAIGGIVCTNSWDEQKYNGPCPPIKQHTYIFTLYALDIDKLPLNAQAHRKDVIAAMEGHILGQTKLTGKYQGPIIRVKS